jgi:hypothetical protein
MFADAENRPGNLEHSHRRSLRGVALVALAAGLLAAAPATAAAVPGGATMFVQSANSGQLGDGRLVLAGVNGSVRWATNRGRSGVISVRRLHRRLIVPGKPATGTLHIAGQRGGRELAFRLSRARYNPARHTVAYRAKPLAGRRAARAAGFRRPRRFGAASLSIIPHPTLMDSSDPSVTSCGVTLINNTNLGGNAGEALRPALGDFRLWDDNKWSPPYPEEDLLPGQSSTWGSETDAGNDCGNFAAFFFSGSRDGKDIGFLVDLDVKVFADDSESYANCTPGRGGGQNTVTCKDITPQDAPPHTWVFSFEWAS